MDDQRATTSDVTIGRKPVARRQEAARPSARRTRSGSLVPAGLLLLGAVPVVAGAVRVTELSNGAAVTPDNVRFFAAPVPVVVHIVGATVFTVVGAFQFAPGLRRRRRGWHRAAGRLLVPAGLAAALSGVWLTLASDLPALDRGLLDVVRVVVGTAMAAAIVLGARAIRRGDVAAHGAWMTRGYAIGMGAGTQAVIFIPWMLVFDQPGRLSRALLMTSGWAINLAVAEWAIRRRRIRRTGRGVAHRAEPPVAVAPTPARAMAETARAGARAGGQR